MLKLIKSFLKRYYILLLVGIIISTPLLVVGLYRTNSAITLVGDITDISSFVSIDGEYETSGTISSIYVKYYEKSTILQNALASLDYTSITEEVSENVSHISDLENYNAGVIQKNSAMMTSIINSYSLAKENNSNINIEYSFTGYKITYYSAKSSFRIGDKLVKVNDKTYELGDIEFKKYLVEVLHNDVSTDTYTVIRDGVEVTINEEDFGSISLYPYYDINYNTLNPKINVSNTTTVGPSAGFLQSLAIYNKITETDITKGKNIAGTGTIDAYGNVGIIGGITQKIYTAFKRGVEIFFCPIDNYEEALEAYNKIDEHEKMALVKIEKFSEALEYLNSI